MEPAAADLPELSLSAAARLVAERSVSPVELTAAAIASTGP
jgi:hypothetical protein